MTEIISIYRLSTHREAWLLELVQRLRSDDLYEALFAAWVAQEIVAEFVFNNRIFQVPGLIEALLKLLESGQPHCRVAACALSRLSTVINSYIIDNDGLEVGEPIKHKVSWQPNTTEVESVTHVLDKISSESSDAETRRWLIKILGNSRDPLALNPLLGRLNDIDKNVRYAAIEALGMLGDACAVEPLLKQLDDIDEQIFTFAAVALGNLNDVRSFTALHEFLKNASPRKRQAAIAGLAQKRDKTDRRLLSQDINASKPWLDPKEPITAARVAEVSKRLKLSEEEVRLRYQALASDFLLQLEWCDE